MSSSDESEYAISMPIVKKNPNYYAVSSDDSEVPRRRPITKNVPVDDSGGSDDSDGSDVESPKEKPSTNDSVSDIETSVSVVDPIQALLNVVNPEHAAVIKALQQKTADLEEKACQMEVEVQTFKRKADEAVVENERLAKRLKTIEDEAAKKTTAEMGTETVTEAVTETAAAAKNTAEMAAETVAETVAETAAKNTTGTAAKKDVETATEREVEEEQVLEIYSSYTPLVSGGSKHPTQLCSSTNLADLLPTELTGSLQAHLHEKTVKNEALSDAQLEAIALTRRRNMIDKCAFIVGDATGVGKSRIALGFIANHYAFTGKKTRVLYLSIGNLFDDVSRDAKAIKLENKFKNGATIKKKGEPIRIDESMLFVPHTAIRAFTAKRLLAWLLTNKTKAVEEKEPILIIDEVHKFTNKTKSGQECAELLNAAHEAGVHIMLLSATFASNVSQLELTAKATGMIKSVVHKVHPVEGFGELARSIRRLGEVGLEALTMQLRTSGGYISRSLSMEGVEFELVEAPMSAVDEGRYKQAATLWKDLRDVPIWNMQTGSVYHSASLRFFKALTMQIRLPAVIENAVEGLERGEQVVLTCLTTDEASIKRSAAAAEAEDGADAEGDDGVDEVEATNRLRNGTLLDNILQVIAVARKAAAGNDKAIESLKGIELRAKALDLPVVAAIDTAKHRLAAALGNDRSKVVELTGRKKHVECDFGDDLSDKTNWKIVDRTEGLLDGKRRFQEGTARVAIVSAAASTGTSLHDVNGARRRVIALELPYSSQQYNQSAGRYHRSGQRSAPVMVLPVLPGVKAESRFAASICARLAQLGAISTGDRRSGAGVVDFGAAAELSGAIANRAACKLNEKHPDIDLGSTPTAIRLMNRCLAMRPSKGNKIMDEFVEMVKQVAREARGKNPRVIEMHVDGNVLTEVDSFERVEVKGVRGRSLVKHLKRDDGLTFEAASAQCGSFGSKTVAFYQKSHVAKIDVASPVAMVEVDGGIATICRPNGKKTRQTEAEFRSTAFVRVTAESARAKWNEWYVKRVKTEIYVVTLPLIDFICTNYVDSVGLVRLIDGQNTLLGMRVLKYDYDRQVKLKTEAKEKAQEKAQEDAHAEEQAESTTVGRSVAGCSTDPL